MKVFLRSAAALLIGYAVITVITIVAFPALLGHALVRVEEPREVIVGTLIAVVAGVAGGYVATRIGVLRPIWNAALPALPVTIETTYILIARTKPEELALSALGAVVLIASTIAPGIWREMRVLMPFSHRCRANNRLDVT